mmetsp:Transcript_8564/g.12230  ORF Transcript_8564/g.12230 Transcript_8564/m.12230 type:complete len:88 (+) Transcript_8564:530-793(+)
MQPAVLESTTNGSLADKPYVNQATDDTDMIASGRGFKSPNEEERIALRTAKTGDKYRNVEVSTPTRGHIFSAMFKGFRASLVCCASR